MYMLIHIHEIFNFCDLGKCYFTYAYKVNIWLHILTYTHTHTHTQSLFWGSQDTKAIEGMIMLMFITITYKHKIWSWITLYTEHIRCLHKIIKFHKNLKINSNFLVQSISQIGKMRPNLHNVCPSFLRNNRVCSYKL